MERNIYKIRKELFITSDEEIKEEDWFIDNKYKQPFKYFGEGSLLISSQKIILTTDQDLIKDNVQAIDDEFLEWFVKNPSCEEVEIESKLTKDGVWTDLKGYVELPTIHSINYKIIIPKEEQKQHIIEMMQNDEELGLYGANIIDNWLEKYGNPEITKQVEREAEELEIEEVAKNYGWRIKTNSFSDKVKANELAESAKQDFIAGAEWQKNRMYSEEDMRLAFEVGRNFQLTGENNFNEILKQKLWNGIAIGETT